MFSPLETRPANGSRTHRGAIGSALSSCGSGEGGGKKRKKRKRITIQNLLNEFKNSYFSTFAIQWLRLGLRLEGGGRKKRKLPFAFLLAERAALATNLCYISDAALLSAVIT